MNSSKNSPTAGTRNPFKLVFGKSRVRPAAIFIILATLATAGFSATSSAGSLHRIIFGKTSDAGKGIKLRAAASGGQIQNISNASAAVNASAGVARHGHTATLLDGGKVLVVGGDGDGTAEVFDASSSTSAVTGGLSIPRFDHTATKLSDGRVLVIGGRSGGTAVASTEIYNTTTGSFEAGPSLGVARAGHSATLLSDGRILVAGGDEAGSVEIYDPASNSFGAGSATLNEARSGHSAALMNDGRVLVVGGRDAGGNEFASAEIYDGAGFSAVGGGMAHHRVGAHLRVLPDGKVQVIGGNDDDSMEVYDPASNQFGAHGHLIPDTDPDAALLEDDILGAQTRAAFFHNGQTDAARDREGHTITEVPQSGKAVVLGGVNGEGSALDSAVILNSSNATVTTDRLDYQPGDNATISGTGWQAGETVNIILHEDPHTHTERRVAAVADADGNFAAAYLVEAHDINVKFIIGAKGATSGRTAQTTFTDSVGVTAGSGGTSISADKAANAIVPAYTTLGDMVINEGTAGGLTTDFAVQTNTTLILTAPGGWQFNPGVGTTATTKSGAGANELTDNSITVTSTTITVNISVTGTTQTNTLSIKGIQVRATDGANVPGTGTILRTAGNPGTATINGIVNGTTSFGSLSQVAGVINKLVVTLPGQTFTDGSTVAGSGNTGSVTNQTAGTSFNISKLTATDQFFNVVTSYSGAKTISYTGPGTNAGFSAPTYTTAVSFASGVSTTTLATTLRKAETTTITASDGTTTGPASSSLNVVAGALSSFVVTNTSDGPISSPQTAGTAFNIKVRAIDADGNTITGFDGGSSKVMIDPSSGTLSAGGGTSDAFTNGVLSPWSVTFATSGTYPGSFSLTATGIGGNSSITGTSNSFTVNGPPCTTPVVTGPTNQAVTYGSNATFTASATGTPTPTLQWQVSTNGGGSWSNIGGATSSPLTVTAPTVAQSGTQYRAVFTNTCGSVNSSAATLTVNKAPLTVTADNASRVYGDANPTFTASYSGFVNGETLATSGVTGSPSLTTTAAATSAVGSHTITAAPGTLAANNYSFSFANGSLSVTKAALTVTADNASREYGDANPAFTASYSGFKNGETFATSGITGSPSLITTATPASSVGGSPYTITAAVGTLSSGNYSFTFANGQLTITKATLTVTADNASREYGDANPTFNASYSGFKNSETLATSGVTGSPSLTTTATASSPAGPHTIAAALGTLAAGNYTFSFVDGTLTVNKATLTVTADNASREYGDANPTFTASYSGFKNGENFGTSGVTGAPSLTTAATVASPVSAYAITAAIGTLASGNYNFSLVNGTLTVNPATLTVTADNASRQYGDANPAFTAGYGGFKNGETFATSGVTGSPSLTTAATAASPAGTYTITAALGTLAATNYTFTFADGTLTVIARAITVNADPQSKTYGDADPALSYQITSGSLFGTDAFSGSLARAAGENVGNYAITQGTLSLSSNYNLTFVGADLTITVRAVTVTADAKSKVYGDADPALTYQVTSGSLAFSDTFSGALARNPGENVGTYAITQGTLTAGANYALTYAGANLTVIARAITVVADSQSKTYGDADPTLTYQVTSGTLVSGDSFSGALSRAAGEAVGGYNINQNTLTAGPNYNLTYVGATFTITARPVTVTADSGQGKTYGDADPALTYQITSGSLAFGDTFGGLLSRAPGENVGSYAITQGTLSLSPNYNLTFVGANFAIGARPITVTADSGQTKVYGDADPAAFTYTVTSGSLAFSDAFSGALSRVAGENVGSYAIQQGTLTAGGNYTLTYVGANFAITKRPLTITAAANTKTYDGNTSAAATPTASGLQFGDTVTGLAEVYDNRNVGTGKTLSVSAYTVNDGNSGNNYTVTAVADTTGVINQAALTITAKTNTKTYDANATAAAAPTVSGLQGSDTVTGLAEVYDNKNVGTGKTLSVSAHTVNDGNGGANYAVTLVNDTTGVINQAALTITALTNNKVYDGSTSAAAVPTVSGIQGLDTVTGLAEVYDNKNVGTGKTLSVSTYTVNDGNGGGNYAVSTVNNTTGVITKRAITVTAVTSTKVYDGTTSSSGTPTVSPTPGGIASGDTANFTQTFDTPLVGTGKTLTPSGSVNDGNGGLNYNVTFVPVMTGTITTGYCFNGFLSPIGGSVETLNGGSFADPLRAFKLNSTIPVKFAIRSWNGTTCGNVVTTGIHTLQASKYNSVADPDPMVIDATPTDAATTGNQFRLTDSEWHFNLNTKGGFSQGTWLLKATLQDGSVHTVWVSIKK